jgi:hypothetical protein
MKIVNVTITAFWMSVDHKEVGNTVHKYKLLWSMTRGILRRLCSRVLADGQRLELGSATSKRVARVGI